MTTRRSATKSPTTSVDASLSEAFEDARSEIDSQIKSPVRLADSIDAIHTVEAVEDEVVQAAPSSCRRRVPTVDDDDLELPPLETLLGGFGFPALEFQADGISLTAELENDLLPSTPLTEEQLRNADSVLKELNKTGVPINQINNETEGEEEYWGYDLKGMMMNAAEQAEEFAISIWHKLQSWKVIHFSHLPQWLQDNDFLHFGHRPPLPTSECFKSIIRIHTETGNIWTHLLGRKNNIPYRGRCQSCCCRCHGIRWPRGLFHVEVFN